MLFTVCNSTRTTLLKSLPPRRDITPDGGLPFSLFYGTAEALREEESDILRLSHMPKRSDGISFYIFVWKKARNQYIVVGFSALPRCRNSAKILQKQLCKTLQRNVFYYMQYVEFKKNSKIPWNPWYHYDILPIVIGVSMGILHPFLGKWPRYYYRESYF